MCVSSWWIVMARLSSGTPGRYCADRVFDVELPLHLQLQDRRRRELLGDRPNAEHRVGIVRNAALTVGQSVALAEQHGAALGDQRAPAEIGRNEPAIELLTQRRGRLGRRCGGEGGGKCERCEHAYPPGADEEEYARRGRLDERVPGLSYLATASDMATIATRCWLLQVALALSTRWPSPGGPPSWRYSTKRLVRPFGPAVVPGERSRVAANVAPTAIPSAVTLTEVVSGLGVDCVHRVDAARQNRGGLEDVLVGRGGEELVRRGPAAVGHDERVADGGRDSGLFQVPQLDALIGEIATTVPFTRVRLWPPKFTVLIPASVLLS